MAWELVPILVPLGAALLAFVAPRLGPPSGLAAALACAVAAAALGSEVAGDGPFRHPVGGWPAPLGIELAVDGLAVLALAMNAAVALGVAVHAAGAFGAGRTRDSFWPVWLLLLAALDDAALSADLFHLYVAFELAGLAAVALVAIGEEESALDAAMRYLLVSLAGSLAYLAGVALLYAAHGTLDLGLLAARAGDDLPTRAALGAIAAGLLLKTALAPLHGWLPAAHGAAPPAASAMLSALVVKVSLLALLRIRLALPAAAALDAAIGGLGAFAVIWGGLLALRQGRLKPLVAYSTVAQLGYLFLAFPLLGTGAAALRGLVALAIAHALAKAAFFLAAGCVKRSLGHDRLAGLGGVAARRPLTALAIALAGVSLIGLPPSGGFAGKWLLASAALGEGRLAVAILILGGGLLAAGYVGRTVAGTLGPPPAGATFAPVPWPMELGALALAAGAIALGLAGPGPWLLVVGGPG